LGQPDEPVERDRRRKAVSAVFTTSTFSAAAASRDSVHTDEVKPDLARLDAVVASRVVGVGPEAFEHQGDVATMRPGVPIAVSGVAVDVARPGLDKDFLAPTYRGGPVVIAAAAPTLPAAQRPLRRVGRRPAAAGPEPREAIKCELT
jgi:hypothetical protein